MPFKMHKIIFFAKCLSKCIKLYFFPEKKKKKYLCLPYLKFSDPLPETHLFFIWPGGKHSKIPNTFLFLFSNKILVIRAGIHKMLVIITNREDPEQTDLGLLCLILFV